MVSGYSVRIAKKLTLLAWLCLVVMVGPNPATAETDGQLREMEASLLHRRIDLGGVKQWDAARSMWRLLGQSTARLRVVNLWSIHCKPCLEEMPLLSKIVHGWRGNNDVQFVLITDPPHDTEEAELEDFWGHPPVDLPAVKPCRSTDDRIRTALKIGTQPITLLLDEHSVVRQAFVGTIGHRNLGAAMERLLHVLKAQPGPAPRKGRGPARPPE